MNQETRLSIAVELMREFSALTGLSPAGETQRRLIEESPGSLKNGQPLSRQVEILMRYRPLAEIIESFWLEPANRQVLSFTEHRDINTVMLATNLTPDGVLLL
jgi:hypothetical protein